MRLVNLTGRVGCGVRAVCAKSKNGLRLDPTYWHTRQESNLQPSILETDALPVAPLIRECKKPARWQALELTGVFVRPITRIAEIRAKSTPPLSSAGPEA